ncbi:MAG: IS200/IS605 family transposase [Candidatus Aenigmarchaeota archaeon]|nr:IS200/IS605 family transposase [Candidatus Aenigmarchaeota archaeon]
MNSFSSSYGQTTVHVCWKVKYCHRIFRFARVKSFCEAVLRQTAQEKGIELREIGFGEEHVHLLISLNPSMSIVQAMHLLKGASAYQIFRAFPWLKGILWGGHLWNPSYYFDSVGDNSYDRLEAYVRNQ